MAEDLSKYAHLRTRTVSINEKRVEGKTYFHDVLSTTTRHIGQGAGPSG